MKRSDTIWERMREVTFSYAQLTKIDYGFVVHDESLRNTVMS